ncbi:hypothetical protein GH733_013003, partial [Mirounga leonina]
MLEISSVTDENWLSPRPASGPSSRPTSPCGKRRHSSAELLGYSEKPINLQMFIGTADDRYLRPHAFYQVHRITGKTVATASQEIIIASTKVLEIPLLPENNMSASIDCAGILKLRNSDIELRKGETDIGRKNTRVRLVFRVHIPQPNGKVLSLQTASIPVECSQRSAQELPHIEKYSINSCSVNGGHEMVVTGSNFLPESKIIFLEKGQDGRPQWEVEGKIIREKCQGAHIVLEVPPYHNPAVTAAVQVHFYLCNGKRKKSQSQRFTYTPVLMKQEHKEEVDLSTVPALSVPHSAQTQRPSSDTGHPHDSVLSTQRSLVCPIQQTYASMVTSSHLPQLQCRDESAGKEQHMISSSVMHQPFQVTSTPPVGSSYQPMQTNIVYNGPTCLPVNAASSQDFDPVLFPQDAALPSLINLGCQPPSSIPFHSSNSSPTGHLLAHTSHSVQTLPHLQSMGFHCANTGQRSLSSPGADQVTGQPSPQLQPITYGPSHSGSATTTSPAVSHTLASSPLSGPPSPQLQSMPYQSPSSGTASSLSLATRMHSGQHTTQAQNTGQGGLSAPSSLICHNLCDPASFPPDEATVNIKPEPEEQEPNFSTIGLQDITLDDVVMLSSLTQTSLCLTWNTSHQVQQRNGLITVSSHVQLLSGESRGFLLFFQWNSENNCSLHFIKNNISIKFSPENGLYTFKLGVQGREEKALRQTQTRGSIIDLTLHTKDAPVLLLVRLVPRAGASKKLQPAVYQRRCPSWVLFPNPALPPPFNGISTYSKAGPISKHLKFAVCFQLKSCNFIYSGRKFFECLYARQCAELVKGWMLLLQGIMSPRCQDSLLRPSKARAGGAGSLPATSSQPVGSPPLPLEGLREAAPDRKFQTAGRTCLHPLAPG